MDRPVVNAEVPISTLNVPHDDDDEHSRLSTGNTSVQQTQSISANAERLLDVNAQDDTSCASDKDNSVVIDPSPGSRRSSVSFVRRLPSSRRSPQIENTIQQLELRNRERGRRLSVLETDTREAEKALNETSLNGNAGSKNTSIISGLLYGLEAARLEMKAATDRMEQAEKTRAADWAKYMQDINDVDGRGIFAKFYEGDIDLVSFLDLAPSPSIEDTSVLVLSHTPAARQSLDAELTAMGLVGGDDHAEELSDLSIGLGSIKMPRMQGAAHSMWGKPSGTPGGRIHSKTPSMLMRRELMRMGARFLVL